MRMIACSCLERLEKGGSVSNYGNPQAVVTHFRNVVNPQAAPWLPEPH